MGTRHKLRATRGTVRNNLIMDLSKTLDLLSENNFNPDGAGGPDAVKHEESEGKNQKVKALPHTGLISTPSDHRMTVYY